MSAVTHVLDTSAILAHYFGEPGAEVVDRLWQDSQNRIGICVVALLELKGRLAAEIEDREERARAFDEYANQLTVILGVDRKTAETAILLRETSTERLPLIDAIIAACAHRRSAVLVHRDPHMESIPSEMVAQLVLPERDSGLPHTG